MKNAGYIDEGAIKTLLWGILLIGVLVGWLLPKLWAWAKPLLLTLLQ